jgi:hypothetical protein
MSGCLQSPMRRTAVLLKHIYTSRYKTASPVQNTINDLYLYVVLLFSLYFNFSHFFMFHIYFSIFLTSWKSRI